MELLTITKPTSPPFAKIYFGTVFYSLKYYFIT